MRLVKRFLLQCADVYGGLISHSLVLCGGYAVPFLSESRNQVGDIVFKMWRRHGQWVLHTKMKCQMQ